MSNDQFYLNDLIGIDLGATNIKAGRVNREGNVLESLLVSTEASKGVEEVIRRFGVIIQKLSKSNQIKAIGVSVPGLVDPDRGIVRSPPNLPGWEEVPLKALLEKSLHIPILINNDVNMVTYGEWRFGAGRGTRNLLCITLGTGVGGGIITDGKLYLGGNKHAGEIGHMIIDPEGPSCKCGGRGCLEALVGAEAIKRRTISLIQSSNRQSSIVNEVKGDLEKITPEVVSKAAQRGDPIAMEMINQVGKEIGIALTNAMALLDPDRVVIGGGISKAGEVLFSPIRKTVEERLYTLKTGKIKILPSELGDNAGVIGSAIYAYEKL